MPEAVLFCRKTSHCRQTILTARRYVKSTKVVRTAKVWNSDLHAMRPSALPHVMIGGLVGEACSGLESCDVSEIIKLEEEVGCSCCASQICGCEPNGKTEEAVFELNEKQRERGITPQCDINGTL